jgi:spore coat protein H
MKFLKYFAAVLYSFLFASCEISRVDGPVDNIDKIPVLDCYTSDENYRILQENKFSNVSVSVDIYNGRKKLNAQFEAQGAGARYFPKWGYYVRLDQGQTIEGENKFNLSIQAYDRTMVKTALASYIYSSAGFDVFHSSHAFLKINGNVKGLYVLAEKIDEGFFIKRHLPVNELIKVVFGAKFTFFSEKNDLKDNFEKKIPDDKNFNNLSDLINAIDNSEADNLLKELGNYIDIKQYLLYHAITSIINNSDGFGNNFYLFKERPNSPYKLLPWDFDKTFDPDARLGFAGDNAIIRKLFLNDSCYSLYKDDLRYILKNYFTEEKLYPIIDSVYIKIKDAYNCDPYLGGNGISLDKEISKVKCFIKERRAYLLNNIDSFNR